MPFSQRRRGHHPRSQPDTAPGYAWIVLVCDCIEFLLMLVLAGGYGSRVFYQQSGEKTSEQAQSQGEVESCLIARCRGNFCSAANGEGYRGSYHARQAGTGRRSQL
jgi:hypothetical protein